MHQRTGFVIVFSVFLMIRLEAQEFDADSTKTYLAKEVVVTATRTTVFSADSPSPVQVMTRTSIESMNGETVADVLKNAHGIFLKDYGSSGSLKTVSMRGTSSEQVLVLVNGVRFNSMQNGLVDLGLLPIHDIDRIEIVRGGSSAFYGADALGGVINIRSREPTTGFSGRIEGSTGSFGYRRYLLEGEGRLGDVGVLAGYGEERGNDNFQFVDHLAIPTGQLVERRNADFFKRQAFVHSNFLVSSNSVLNFSVQHVKADRGTPGPVSFPSNEARQKDDDVNILASYKTGSDNGIEFTLGSSFHYNYETYSDPNPFFPINSTYKNLYLNLNPQYEVFVIPEYKLILGAEFGQGNLDGNDFDSRISRVHRSLYWSNQVTLGAERSELDRLVFYGTIRYDDISDVDRAITPKLGLNVRLFRQGEVHLRGSYGRNFRAPSFNDMYYRGFSNPTLKPELSTSLDIGLTTTFLFLGEQTFEATYFDLNTRNRILFDPVTYLPVNIGEAASQGFEARYHGGFLEGIVDLELNYALTNARKKNRDSANDPTFDKQLIYIPRESANGSVSVRLHPVSVNIFHNFVGRRFTMEDNSASLPAHELTNLNVSLDLQTSGAKLVVKGEVNNVLDKDYEIFKDYPMPMRNFRITLSVSG